MLLQQTARLGLRSRAACVSYLGASFRTPLQLSETKSDYTVSEMHCSFLPRTPLITGYHVQAAVLAVVQALLHSDKTAAWLCFLASCQ